MRCFMPIPKYIKQQIQQKDSKIISIDLSNCNLNDNDISELQELLQNNSYINSINLADNNFTEAGCKLLRLIPGLKKLNLSGCYVGDKGLNYFIGSKIEVLNVSNCGITKDGAAILLANINQFKELDVDKNPRIPADILHKIRQKFIPGLTGKFPHSSPVGIDLGLNINSSYEFFNKSLGLTGQVDTTSQHAAEKTLADKLSETYEAEMKKLPPSDIERFEKEQFVKNFCKNLGIEVEIKPQSALKAS
jgi:hypothetical protein